MIDQSGYQEAIAKGEERALVVQKDIYREILSRELIASRIIRECWDSMQTKGTTLHSFMSFTSVYNYPVSHRYIY